MLEVLIVVELAFLAYKLIIDKSKEIIIFLTILFIIINMCEEPLFFY